MQQSMHAVHNRLSCLTTRQPHAALRWQRENL